jgi:hypothetical protein
MREVFMVRIHLKGFYIFAVGCVFGGAREDPRGGAGCNTLKREFNLAGPNRAELLRDKIRSLDSAAPDDNIFRHRISAALEMTITLVE